MNKLFLRVEGLMVLILSIGYYSIHEYNWWLFIILFFTPDFSMIGYLINHSIGAKLYNFFHTYNFPLLFIIIGFITNQDIILAIGIIWVAHIAMDRALGYGLKYSTAFKDTHLQRV